MSLIHEIKKGFLVLDCMVLLLFQSDLLKGILFFDGDLPMCLSFPLESDFHLS